MSNHAMRKALDDLLRIYDPETRLGDVAETLKSTGKRALAELEATPEPQHLSCPECGSDTTKLVATANTGLHRVQSTGITIIARQCTSCNFRYISPHLAEIADLLIAAELAKHNPEPSELTDDIRRLIDEYCEEASPAHSLPGRAIGLPKEKLEEIADRLDSEVAEEISRARAKQALGGKKQ